MHSKTGTVPLAVAEFAGKHLGFPVPVVVLELPVAHQVELTLERLDFRSAITNLIGHNNLARRCASGQAFRTNGPSGRKSSGDAQTLDIIRLIR